MTFTPISVIGTDIYAVTDRTVSQWRRLFCLMKITICRRLMKLFLPKWRHHHLMRGGLNGSTQHSILKGKDGVFGNASRLFSRLYGIRENRALGSLAGGESLKAIRRAFGK